MHEHDLIWHKIDGSGEMMRIWRLENVDIFADFAPFWFPNNYILPQLPLVLLTFLLGRWRLLRFLLHTFFSY